MAPLRTQGADLVDESGKIISLKGISWFGFNTGTTMVDGLWGGEAITVDFATAVHRLQLLGFNAVRLPFSFRDLHSLQPRNFSKGLDRPTVKQVAASVVPPGCSIADGMRIPSLVHPPEGGHGKCNDYLPNTSVLDRFVWVVRFFARNGFYVLLDNHMREDQTALADPPGWAAKWADLVRSIIQDDGATSGRVLVDILNEPDNFGLRWEAHGGTPGLADLYLRAMDAIHAVAPHVLYLIEGSGQAGLGANWGDGFATDGELIARHGLSDPRAFFAILKGRPYAQQVVLAPHVYGPDVTFAPGRWCGRALRHRLSASFGHCTLQDASGSKRLFPVAIGEFGSSFAQASGWQTMMELVDYMNSEGAGADGQHAQIQNWFYWCWNANSGDTGGIVADDWTTIQWGKVAFLCKLGLRPWFTDWPDPPTLPQLLMPTAPASAPERNPKTEGSAAMPQPARSPDGASLAEAFEVAVSIGAPWQHGTTSSAAAVNLTVRNLGPEPVPVPWTIQLMSDAYSGISDGWNCAASFARGCVKGVAAADWQALLPNGTNSPSCGMVIISASSALAPDRITLNGHTCKFTVEQRKTTD